MTDSTDDYLPISALNDLLFCERRCALHRIENVWVDNAHTVSGTFLHERADRQVTWEVGAGVRAVHGLLLKSDRLQLVGKADVVEFHDVGQVSNLPGTASDSSMTGRLETRPTVPYPVEYKRGKRRRWDNDEVQVCAQALCLEEMLGVVVPAGAIFHIQSKRRREVVFTPELRELTAETARRLHALIQSGITPRPVRKARCRGCSLLELCLPALLADSNAGSDYQQTLFDRDWAEEM